MITQPMANEIIPPALTTRQKISLSKTKYTNEYLMQAGVRYVEKILNQTPDKPLTPSVVGFCLEAGISKSRLYELAATNTEVADIVEYVGMLGENHALNGGMHGKTNPIFSMFYLKAAHHYQDSPQQLTQNNTFNVSADLLADALQLMKENKKPGIKD